MNYPPANQILNELKFNLEYASSVDACDLAAERAYRNVDHLDATTNTAILRLKDARLRQLEQKREKRRQEKPRKENHASETN
jgi:hypothetical protein